VRKIFSCLSSFSQSKFWIEGAIGLQDAIDDMEELPHCVRQDDKEGVGMAKRGVCGFLEAPRERERGDPEKVGAMNELGSLISGD
jgi:hypothetical protein